MTENPPANENPSAKSGLKKWLLLLACLLVVYVLSWGVVFAMYGTGRIAMPVAPWVKSFYFPVQWMQNNTLLGTPLLEYLSWWARTLTQNP